MATVPVQDEALIVLSVVDEAVNNDEPPTGPSERRVILSRKRDSIKIGRSSRRKVELEPGPHNFFFDCPVVSRNHAMFKFDTVKKTVYIVDTNSLHGTYVNKLRLREDRPIRTGDVLTFGMMIDRGSAVFRPFQVEANVTFGTKALSPATITYKVPDESDVEEIDSDDIDGAEGVAYARRVLRENHIRPAKDSLFLRSEIDLTVGDDEPPTLIIDEAVPTQRDTERTGTATKLPSNTFVDLTCSTNDDIALESSVPDMDTDEENFLQETHPQETQAIEDADVGEDDESSLDWAEHSSFYDESENSHQNEEPENHVPLTELPEPFQRFATDSIHVAVPYPAQSLQLPPIRNVPPPFEAQRQHADNLSWASQGQFRNMNMNIERNSGYAPVNPITSSYNTQPLLGVPLPPSPFCCGPAEFASRLEEAEHLEAGEQDKPVAQNMKGPYQSPYGGFEAHRAPSIPPCDNTDINRSFESPLVQSSFQLLHSPISPEHADPEPSEGPVLDETSAYHFELSKKASSQPPQEMASERQEMNANFDESTPALPPTAMSTKPLKRKAEEISQTTPEEEPGQAEEASSATAPSTNSSQVPTSLVTQSSCGSRTKDIRPIKRVRRAAEVFGFVALGGVAVMSALIATAPAL